MNDTAKQEIQEKDWKIQEGVVVHYYVDEGHQKEMEEILSHENLSMRFPFDTAKRQALMPFAVLSNNVGYAGLDQEGYNALGKFLQDNFARGDTLFIGSIPLNTLAKGDEQDLAFLYKEIVNGKEVFFPDGYFVLGNK